MPLASVLLLRRTDDDVVDLDVRGRREEVDDSIGDVSGLQVADTAVELPRRLLVAEMVGGEFRFGVPRAD